MWIALEEEISGTIPSYEFVEIDLQNKSKEFQELYAKSNPLPGARAKVPLLQIVTDDDDDNDDGFLLCESLVVTEYLAHEYVNNLLPSKVEDRAIMKLFSELCGTSFSYFPILRVKDSDDPKAKEEAKLKFVESLVATNSFLKHYGSNNGPFLFGKQFTLAECNVAPFVQRMCIVLPAMTDDDVNPIQICEELQLTHLKAWILAILQRPSVQSTSVPKEVLINNMNKMLERMNAAASSMANKN